MSHPEVDQVNAMRVIQAVEELNRAISVAVEHGLTVDLSVLEHQTIGRTRARPVVDVEVGRSLARTGLRR